MSLDQLNFRLSSWLSLGSITLLQATCATRSIFSACSSLMEQNYHISHVQLNSLIAASETGRQLSFVSTAAAAYLPAWMILFIGLLFGSVGYGVQYFSIAHRFPALSYWQALLLNVIGGNSSCWINTYCNLLAKRNFKNRHSTITGITSTYSWLSVKIFTSLVDGIEVEKDFANSSTHLLLACLVPVAAGLIVAVVNIGLQFMECGDTDIYPAVFGIAIATGVYAVIESVTPAFKHLSSRLRAAILVMVSMLPFAIALLTAAADHMSTGIYHSQELAKSENATTKEVKVAIGREREADVKAGGGEVGHKEERQSLCMRGNNDPGIKQLLLNLDFWIFNLVNASGATLGMVYLNNLERITQSRSGSIREKSVLMAISSAFGFFGRVFSVMFHWYTRERPIIANPALTAILMIPMPVAVFLLLDSQRSLYISTGILGTCSGVLNEICLQTTCQLFGCKNFAVKQTIVLTNIPLGSLLFGYLAAINYEKEGAGDQGMCIGANCYHRTFVIWGSISLVGTILSILLHLRTQNYYSQTSESVGN